MQYIIYVERDQFPDPERYPDGTAYRSGILDADTGEEIDGEGDLPDFETAKSLAMSTLDRMLHE